ncbi:MAG: PAS domain S-box protein [Pseudomonadota bacterium]
MDELVLLRTQLELSASALGRTAVRYYDALHELRRLTLFLFRQPGPTRDEVERWFEEQGFGVDADGFWLGRPLLEKFREGRAPDDAVSVSWNPALKNDAGARGRMFRLLGLGKFLKELRDRLAGVAWIYYQDVANVALQFPYIDQREAITPDFDWSSYHTWMSAAPARNPERKIRWTEPTIDYAGEGLILSVSIPVYLGEEFIGLWSLDVPQAFLLAQAQPREEIPGQLNFIVDVDGKIVAHPEIETEIDQKKGGVYRKDLPSLGGGWSGLDLPGLVASGTGPLSLVNEAGEELRGSFCYVPEVGWLLFSVVPLESLTQRMVSRLNQALDLVKHGDLSHRLLSVSGHEPHSRLIDSFNEMVQALQLQEKERNAAERALRKSELEYRKLFLQSPAGIFQFNPQGKFRKANPAFSHMLGFKSPEEMAGPVEKLGDLLVDKRQEGELNRLCQDQAWRLGHEFRFFRKDGSTAWVSISLGKKRKNTPYRDAFARDVTARKQAEENSRESEERWLFALEGSRDGVWDWDVEADKAFFSKRWKEILGYEEQEFLGSINEWESRIHPDDSLTVGRQVKGHLNGESPFFESEHRVLCRDGTYKWVLARGKVIRRTESGLPLRMIGTQTDITDRKNAENALLESERKFRRLFDTSPQAIALTELENGRLVDVNDKFCEITKTTKQDVLGRTTVQLGLYSEADRKRFADELKVDGRVDGLDMDFRDMRDGSTINALMFASMLRLQDKWHILTVFHDITAAKRLEAQLQQAQKMEAVGTLAGGVAHDFNNLLQAINGYTQIMLMEKEPADPDYSNLSAIQQAGSRAAQLVRQLLVFSRKVEIERRSVDINQEVEQAVRLLARTIPKMIAIEFRAGTELWGVKADPIQIESVLLNLGCNAADAMPDGGNLLIETDNVTLDEESAPFSQGTPPGRYVLITVSDDGQGIDREVLPHIFEPFFTTKGVGKGTGLGLASVYGIIKGHGGAINCYSEPGMGATFRLYLPALDDGDGGAGHHQALVLEKPAIRGGGETILVVDDEDGVRGFASMALERVGYAVITASSGEKALEIYAERRSEIDLVILDLGMPGMGGYNCLREIRNINPQARVVIASGYALNGPVKKVMHAGAVGFLGKPYLLVDLLAQVRRALDA